MICKQASLQQSKAPRKHDGQHQCTYGAKIGCFEALVVGAFSTRGYAYRVSKYRSWGPSETLSTPRAHGKEGKTTKTRCVAMMRWAVPWRDEAESAPPGGQSRYSPMWNLCPPPPNRVGLKHSISRNRAAGKRLDMVVPVDQLEACWMLRSCC